MDHPYNNFNSSQYSYNQYNYYYNYYASLQISVQNYTAWYNTLNQNAKAQNYTPQQYYQYYQQQYELYSNNMLNNYHNSLNNPDKKQKLTRNQKRRLKKKQLKQQYQKQQKQIGKWVNVQRKDLVDELKKIEEQQLRRKQKKKQKLAHLIPIHKQVYKHMMKKNKTAQTNLHTKTNHIVGRRKKKVSQIKKMKQLYQDFKIKGQGQFNGKIYKYKFMSHNYHQKQNQVKKQKLQIEKEHLSTKIQQLQQQNSQNDYITDEEDGEELKISKQIQVKQVQEKEIRFVDKIDYKFTSKLANHVHNKIVLRQWVDHLPSPQLEDVVLRLANRLAYKQAINKINKPQKYKKLIIGGVHQCRRTLMTKLDKKKCRLLIIALNIQKNQLSKGIDDQIQELIQMAHQQKIPVVHVSTRAKLGRAFTGKFGPRFTMLSIINYQGYQDMMKQIMQIYQKTKQQYDYL